MQSLQSPQDQPESTPGSQPQSQLDVQQNETNNLKNVKQNEPQKSDAKPGCSKLKLFIITFTVLILLGGLGVLIWRLTLPEHTYQENRQNSYQISSRTCVSSKLRSDNQKLSEDCYDQVINSRIITNRVESERVSQSLLVDQANYKYQNGSSLDIQGFKIEPQTLANLRRRLQEGNGENQDDGSEEEFKQNINKIPIFSIEVDPTDNSVKKIGIPVDVDRILVGAALQQLHHSNGGESEAQDSLLGLRYVNGQEYNPTVETSFNIFGGRKVKREISGNNRAQRNQDNLQNLVDLQIKQSLRTNSDGEVSESEIQATQTITQETDSGQVDMTTTTTQNSQLQDSRSQNDDNEVIKYIQERQQYDYYDASNITLAYLSKEDQKEIKDIQNRKEDQNLQEDSNGNRLLVPTFKAELLNIANFVVGEKNILGYNVQIVYNIYAFLQSDDTTCVRASLFTKINGQNAITMFSIQMDNLKTQDSAKLSTKIQLTLLKFVFPIIGIPCVIDLKSNFDFGYNFDYQFVSQQSIVNFNTFGTFAVSAQGYVETIDVNVGAQVSSTIAKANIPAFASANLISRSIRRKVSITAGTSLELKLFAKYPKITIIYLRIGYRIGTSQICLIFPIAKIYWFQEKVLSQISNSYTERSWVILDNSSWY